MLAPQGQNFKDWETATLVTGVIVVTKATSDTKAEKIYQEAMEQLRKKIPEDIELVGLEPEDVIQYLNFKRIQKLEEQNELLRSEIEMLRTDMKRLEKLLKELLGK